MRTMRALRPGSVKSTALGRERFKPSTFISTVAPRATPKGVTELIVGGVVRLPVGHSVELWAKAAAVMATKSRMRFIQPQWITLGANVRACRAGPFDSCPTL